MCVCVRVRKAVSVFERYDKRTYGCLFVRKQHFIRSILLYKYSFIRIVFYSMNERALYKFSKSIHHT